MTREQTIYIRERATQMLIVIYYGCSVWRFLQDFLHTHRPTSLLALIFLSLIVIFSLLRQYPKQVVEDRKAWLAAFLGTAMTASFLPAAHHHPILLYLGEPLQMIGIVLTSISLLALNRSFALVAANRGIKTQGFYRYVRHPMYASYMIYDLGLLLSQFSIWNLVVAILVAAFAIVRIRYEEALLMQDETYREYAACVRYRLLPRIW